MVVPGARLGTAEAPAQRHHVVHVPARCGQHPHPLDRSEALVVRRRGHRRVTGRPQERAEIAHARVDVVERRVRVELPAPAWPPSAAAASDTVGTRMTLPTRSWAYGERPLAAAKDRVVNPLAAAIDQSVSPGSTVWPTLANAG